MRFGLVLLSFALTACGGSVANEVAPVRDAGNDSSAETSPEPFKPPPPSGESSALTYSGSILPPGAPYELSAPLFPDMIVFQRFQDGSRYPATTAAETQKLLDDHVKTFDQLLVLCAPVDSRIKLRADGDPPLTLEQIRINYDAVARCGYEKYGAKPYWVPQMVADHDICARKLGPDWHLPTAADIGSLSESDFKLFSDTLTALPGADWFPVQWYYRLEVYARDAMGALALGNLAPAATHVSPLPVSGAAMNALYLGDGKPIGLRCFRKR